jgi:hypothetical protein
MTRRRRLRGKSETRNYVVSIFVTRDDRVLILWYVSQVESHLITDVHPADLHIVTLPTSNTTDRYPITSISSGSVGSCVESALTCPQYHVLAIFFVP